MKNELKYKEARTMILEYLRDLARAKNITHAQIAERTGFKANNVSRMLTGRYPPTLDNLLRLVEAVDAYIFVIDKDADDDLVETMRDRWGKISES